MTQQARLVVLLERRVEIVFVPGEVLVLDEIAARLVGRHRGTPARPVLNHEVEQVGQLLGVEIVLDVQLAGAAKTMDLVVRVVLGREVLNPIERGIGHAVEVLDAADTELDIVLRRRLLHTDVNRRGQSDLLGFVHQRFELIAVVTGQLQPVGAPRLRLAHDGADAGGRTVELSLRADHIGERRIVEDAGRDNGVLGRLLAPQVGLVDITTNFTNRRRSRGEIQVALVLDRHRNARHPLLVPVHVRVHQAWHDVLAGGIDDGVRLGRCRPSRRRGRLRAARGCDPRDQATLDEDVHRAIRRLGVAVDDHRVLDEQALEAPVVCGSRHGPPRCRPLRDTAHLTRCERDGDRSGKREAGDGRYTSRHSRLLQVNQICTDLVRGSCRFAL